MSDTPKNQFLYEFGIAESRARFLIRRVTQIVVKNLKIWNEPGSDVVRCGLDKSGCVRDIVQYIEYEDLDTVDAQWMFFAFGASIGNNDRLCEIARAEYTARQLFETLKTETAQEE
ncbi:MAG: hypothetical protein GX216_11720 [Methanomicrobiales archaeon]|nr:hypothetical protein [Methanomicrobiales archaeon]